MNLLLAGASGRMGQAILAEAGDHTIIPLTRGATTLPTADALIDFTRPERALELARLAAEAQMPFVSGTTGFSDGQFAELRRLATHMPILWAANMSLGVNLLLKLVREAAARLDDSYDIDICEMHHRHKLDAPSGTALALGKAAAEGHGIGFKPVTERSGSREAGSIGFAVARGGGVIGEHSVIFASDYERITLSHSASDRRLFARGALKAAEWLSSQKPGWYTMEDMLVT